MSPTGTAKLARARVVQLVHLKVHTNTRQFPKVHAADVILIYQRHILHSDAPVPRRSLSG